MTIRLFDALEPVPQYPPVEEDPHFTSVVRNLTAHGRHTARARNCRRYAVMALMLRNWKEPLTASHRFTALAIGATAGSIKAYSYSHYRLNGVLENGADHAKWARIRAAEREHAQLPATGLKALLRRYLGPGENVDMAALDRKYYGAKA